MLLLQSEAADGNTTFTDSSKNKHTITYAGTVRHETDNYKFGTSSIYMTNSKGSYLDIPDSDCWSFGSEDFTIEYWVKKDYSGDWEYIWSWLPSDGTEDLSFRFTGDTTGTIHISESTGGPGVGSHITGSGNVTYAAHGTTNWHHHAFVRNGSTYKFYVNGVAQTLQNGSTSISWSGSDNNYEWKEITDIGIEVGLHKVYNINVEENDVYYAQNYLMHNKG